MLTKKVLARGAATAVALVACLGLARAEEAAVKVGILNDMSSLYADLGGPGSVASAKMAIEDFGGTLFGKPIELVNADHQNKADIGAAIARQWYERDNVDAIADVPNSAVGLAVQGVSKDLKKVALLVAPSSSDITGPNCSPYSAQWVFDTYSLAHVTGANVVKQGGDTWFFITADYAFGHALQRDTAQVVTSNGGKVLGSVNVPLNNADFSSFLLQAQSSKAKIIGLANAGGDTINSIKQAAEFGIVSGGQKLAGLLVFISDVHSLGLQVTQGIQLTEAFYWDQNEETRAWSKRFFERTQRMPTMIQAGVYSALMHYFKAVKAAGTKDADKVMAQMRAMPINDFMTKNGQLRIDGRVMRDMYLFEVKKPSESKGPWDYYKQLATVPAEQAYRPLDKSCPLVQ